MRKNELKVGYVVETRNGRLLMVIDESDGRYKLQNGYYDYLSDYTPDLCFKPSYHLYQTLENESDFDIIRVYGYPASGFSFVISKEGRSVLWEREESRQKKSCDRPYCSDPLCKGSEEFDYTF